MYTKSTSLLKPQFQKSDLTANLIVSTDLDICERDLGNPLNFIHIPRCVLAYCAAVNFQIPTMASRILTILEETAKHLTEYLSVHYIYKEMDFKTSRSIATYFVSSIDILYSETLFELMKPMRHALAGILDALLPSLLRQPYFPEMLSMPSWKRWSAAIAADQVEYRTALGHFRSSAESIIPSELQLEALFDRVLGQFDRDQEKKCNSRESYEKGPIRRGDGGSKEGDKDNMKELNKDESTSICQAPSVISSTGSETGTCNSLGTDGAQIESGGPSNTGSFTNNNTSVGVNADTSAGVGRGLTRRGS
ncbi:hypothetical protein TARUN_7502 [Trichoderma arundinaceum]|uniref:Uncharacterized protein n=1 Tax=Trichoderma arundinaceum TaxID=490622 RepID=A0A395NF62_TRIAR|nr:hypothetical protein TARUN_7502 [Trichoderma arundinaceum]